MKTLWFDGVFNDDCVSISSTISQAVNRRRAE